MITPSVGGAGIDKRGDAPPAANQAVEHGLPSGYESVQERDDKFLTTEHSALQSASATAVAEGSTRTNLFLITISGSLIALSFIGQISHLGLSFFVFALVLFPSLFFLGLVTFQRTVETGVQNIIYLRGMNRICHYYIETAPQLRKYFILSTHDDVQGALYSMGFLNPGRRMWQSSMMTTGGMVAFINSVLAGMFVGMVFRLILNLFIALADNDLPSLFGSAAVGLVVFILSVFLHFRHQIRAWQQMNRMLDVEFPGASQVASHPQGASRPAQKLCTYRQSSPTIKLPPSSKRGARGSRLSPPRSTWVAAASNSASCQAACCFPMGMRLIGLRWRKLRGMRTNALPLRMATSRRLSSTRQLPTGCAPSTPPPLRRLPSLPAS